MTEVEKQENVICARAPSCDYLSLRSHVEWLGIYMLGDAKPVLIWKIYQHAGKSSQNAPHNADAQTFPAESGGNVIC
jgi:hypothetical protein